MKNFDEVYNQYVLEFVSPKLKELLGDFYRSSEQPIDLLRFKLSLKKVLEFLDSLEGRKKANYKAVDFFISDYDDLWKPLPADLPEKYQEIYEDIELLHGSLDQPEFHIEVREILAKLQDCPPIQNP